MTQEFYVAFSIHGSNCFITAAKSFDTKPKAGAVSLDGMNFTTTQPRMGQPKNNAIKLNTDLLMKDSKPLSDPKEIWFIFDRFRSLGWKVEDAAFIKKHKINLTPKPVAQIASAPQEEPSVFQCRTTPNKPVAESSQVNEKPAEKTMVPRPLGARQIMVLNDVVAMTPAPSFDSLKSSTGLKPSQLKETLAALVKLNRIKHDEISDTYSAIS